jgi:Flp pilus assembly pilin Flp
MGRMMTRSLFDLKAFLRHESGAVTVDYVILTAGAVVVAIASAEVIFGGLRVVAGNVNEESTGTPLNGTVPATVYDDNFENGTTGWTGVTANEASGIGGVVLGPIGGEGGGEQVQRTFTLSDGLAYAKMSFDLYAIDDLGGASGNIYVGGQKVGSLVKNGSETTFVPVEVPGVKIEYDVISTGSNIAGANRPGDPTSHDSQTRISILYENPDPVLTFGFGSNGPSDTSLGSFSIDDFEVVEYRNTDATEDGGDETASVAPES